MANLRDQLEPNALFPDWSGNKSSALESEIEASKAISLRRLAESLESIAAAWGKQPPSPPALCAHGEDWMDCAKCAPF